jgi:ABC-type transport system substrate-binding protein
LEAFSDYWNKGIPKSKSLTFKFIPMNQQVDALLAGDIDILTSLPGTRTYDIQKNPATYVIKKRTFYTVGGSFNISRKPLSNRRIRQALNMAIDKEDLIRYDILGNGRPIAALSMSGEFGHAPNLEPYPYDPKTAKKIFAEEGYPNGFTLNVFLKANAERTGQIIASHLARVGVKLNLTIVSDAEIFKYLKDRNQWDMLIADCPDPMYHSYFISAAFLYSKSNTRSGKTTIAIGGFGSIYTR